MLIKLKPSIFFGYPNLFTNEESTNKRRLLKEYFSTPIFLLF